MAQIEDGNIIEVIEMEQIEIGRDRRNERRGSQESLETDPWEVGDLADNSVPFNVYYKLLTKRDQLIFEELNTKGKVYRVLWNYIFRQILLIVLLYLFICSLDFLSSAFRLLGGKAAGQVFKESSIFENPVAGLMIGVLATVLVQSSSTSTSIVVAMVGAQLLKLENAIPMIMGANIGTSVTNTIVSLGQSGDMNQFRRAFGGATVHDMFNWLSVLILLPLEIITGYLARLSEAIVKAFNIQTYAEGNRMLLIAIITPFTKYIVKVETDLITDIALNETDSSASLIKTTCTSDDGTTYLCSFMFMKVAGKWDDWVIGLILLFIALFVLCTCLILVVKILKSMFKGHIANLLKRFINADFPGRCGRYGTGYLAILIGALITILIQSSSIFTSTLTPLVGVGVIHLDRMYPLTLGANIGTTFTTILASLTQEGVALEAAMQVSMCHLFFNLSGILLWYPVTFMRRVPIYLAKKLGNTVAMYRWFAVVYIIMLFFALPVVVFALSLTGWKVFTGIIVPILLFIIIIVTINIIQVKRPQLLPNFLRTWEFLPKPLRSLEPYDVVVTRVFRQCQCCNRCYEH